MLIENQILFGLSDRDIDTIFSVLKKYPEVMQVYIFGSRAKGNYKPYSDIDMAVMNDGVTDKAILHIKSEIEDSTLPYRVDILNYPTLTHAELKEHIDRVGMVFYHRAI